MPTQTTLRLALLPLLANLLLLPCAAQGDASRPAAESLNSELYLHTRAWLQGLNRRGFTFSGQFTQDWSREWNDPDSPSSGFSRYSLDLMLAVDGQKSLGWKGASGLLRLKHHVNEIGSGDEDARQLYSNIDAPSRTGLYELWIEQRLRRDALRLKGGRIDANSEFAVVEGAGDFLNSSMGYSPTIVAFPTYPEPKLGLAVFLKSHKDYSLSLGVFQTAGWGTLSIAEPGFRWHAADDRDGRVSVGYWRLDGTFSRWDGSRATTTQGVFAVAEQLLWRRPLSDGSGERGLSAFLQLGKASPSVSAFASHAGAGFVFRAPWARRPHDSVGAAATWVRMADACNQYEAAPGSELIAEAYYKVALTRNLSFIADSQYIHHPGIYESGEPVATTRLVVSF